MKKFIFSFLMVSLSWFILHFIAHNVLLQNVYLETISLWRNIDDLKPGLSVAVTILTSAFFVLIFDQLIYDKTIFSGLQLGIYIGMMYGLTWGIGSYCFLPIPLSLALSWLVISLIECGIGGAIMGLIYQKIK